MTGLREAMGKPVILRETAEQIGHVRFFAVDGMTRRVTAVVVASGRSNQVVEWAQIENVGPDAVIVNDSHEPSTEDDRTTSGALNPIDKRVLTDLGNELAPVTDLEVDDDGVVRQVVIGDKPIDGTRLRGIGSYAVVVEADPAEA
jgi:sporulation protein YlmC with PRC-barrel domain